MFKQGFIKDFVKKLYYIDWQNLLMSGIAVVLNLLSSLSTIIHVHI